LAGTDPSGIRAYTVLSPAKVCVAATVEQVNAVFALLGKNDLIRAEELAIDGAQLCGGYGMPTSEMIEAIKLVGRSEGLLLDPVYGAK
ncbi:D-cysteine desulfhydrase family protein, partial [Rhizobium ruizarguesonis]